MQTTNIALPRVVTRAEWPVARQELHSHTGNPLARRAALATALAVAPARR